MSTVQIDARGLRCPTPVLKMTNAVMKREAKPGDTLVVLADCPTFEKDVREWCKTMNKVLLVFKDESASVRRVEIRI